MHGVLHNNLQCIMVSAAGIYHVWVSHLQSDARRAAGCSVSAVRVKSGMQIANNQLLTCRALPSRKPAHWVSSARFLSSLILLDICVLRTYLRSFVSLCSLLYFSAFYVSSCLFWNFHKKTVQ